MSNSSQRDPRTSMGRRSVLGGGAALAAGSIAALQPSGSAAAQGRSQARDADEAAIRQLSINYALGTDAVASGDTAVALDYYLRTFSDDAAISAGFDRSAPLLSATGPNAWADLVIAAFTPYTATQHLLGTINVALDPPGRGGSASMTSYLQATHVFADSMDLLVVLGTYVDTVEQRPGAEWRITTRFLQFTSFSTTTRTAPAVAE